jgi:fibronectin type 3 domain-containing protein
MRKKKNSCAELEILSRSGIQLGRDAIPLDIGRRVSAFGRRMLFFLLLSSATCGSGARAQSQHVQPGLPVFNSARGPVILISNQGLKQGASADSAVSQFRISRMEASNPRSLRNLGPVFAAASPDIFRKIAGEEVWEQLRKRTKGKTDAGIWQYLQQHPSTDDYGFLAFNPLFRKAMGTAYIDEEVRNKKNTAYTYQMEIVARGGRVLGTVTGDLTIGRSPDFLPPAVGTVKATDSLVAVTWRQKVAHDVPYFAFVYKQAAGRGSFQKLSARVLVRHKKDSVYYTFTEKVNANSAYRYFIRPADLMDNTGDYNSDTASLVAANFRKLPMIGKLKAKDTLDAILVSWNPLPVNPLITGIEILRSRDPRGDFVVMDTVSALAHSWLDKRLLPHIAYYYKVCVLHAGTQLASEKFYASVSADQQKTTRIPDPPYGLGAQTTPKGVFVHWQPVSDPDLYAYYVYRGTSLNAKMQVISPALTDTSFTDTASNLSRQTSYVYAVKSVTSGNKESPFSGKVSAHLAGGKERPQTPGGIRITPRAGTLYIEWEDTKRNNPGIVGYILYKRRAGGPALQYDITRPASVEATRLNLSLAVDGVVTAPYYEDTLGGSGDRYEYLVSAIDKYGVESGLSAVAASSWQGVAQRKPPAQVFARAVPEGVSLQWEQADPAGVEGFVLYRRTIGEKKARRIAQVKSTVSQYTDKQAAHGNLYVYSVTTVTAAGETLPSDERSVRK